MAAGKSLDWNYWKKSGLNPASLLRVKGRGNTGDYNIFYVCQSQGIVCMYVFTERKYD
jgi:hypothetical protein